MSSDPNYMAAVREDMRDTEDTIVEDLRRAIELVKKRKLPPHFLVELGNWANSIRLDCERFHDTGTGLNMTPQQKQLKSEIRQLVEKARPAMLRELRVVEMMSAKALSGPHFLAIREKTHELRKRIEAM
jgi:hypothetical protein